MARTGIKNIASGPITLPLPLHGVLQPNKSVISSLTLAEANTLFNTANLLKQVRCVDLADVGDVTTGLEGDVSMNGVKITDLGTPTAATDAATKAYVDSGGAGALDATEIVYGPTTTGDWPGTDPAEVEAGLDRLAARTNAMTYGRTRAADALAADVTSESLIERVLRAGTITMVRYVPTGALTASDTHYATITVRQRDAAGANPVTVATLITNVAGGSWTAFVAKSLGALTNAAVVAGAILTYQIEKAGDGVVVPDGRLEVVVEPASGA